MFVQEERVGAGVAHGKAVLLGEHTVVYGTPAIAVPIPALAVSASARLRHYASDKRKPDLEVALDDALRYWKRDGDDLEFTFDSSIPSGRGLGFSAACAAAAVRAAADLYGETMDADTLHDLIQKSERVAHGRASGVDARTVVARGPIWFEDGDARPLAVGADAVVVVADTGIPGATRKAVDHVRARLAADPRWAEDTVAQAASLVRGAVEDLAAGRVAALGQRMLDFHDVLACLGVNTPATDRLVTAAVEAGALGAKVTGGGLGGCVIALADPHGDAAHLCEALQQAGAVRTWPVQMGSASC
ncbi:mevalonate kinase [Actinomadura rudentiformis]|uniref:Mevalonate kinase n=1 Tax=Actinomadura rudentiformis TaxID=359158 RepID=A0A6H9YYG0_9ACTN|nr:mevalonate kinase [Actinomadura rudentiformis]KAB2346911.1 mevalonate kinase [Actinomadura rudentiformis]